jgi:hypothetical protein
MTKQLIDQLIKTREEKCIFEQEGFILEFTELICKLMEDKRVSRKELAKRLSKLYGHKAKEEYVNEVLDGDGLTNITEMSDIAFVLGYKLQLAATKLS